MSGFKDRYKGSRAEEPESRPREDRLESNAKSVRQNGPYFALRAQRKAAKILVNHRVGHCRWTVRSVSDGVDLVRVKMDVKNAKEKTTKSITKAHFTGLQTCGSVWVCPCCSEVISLRRRDEMNQLLRWARSKRYDIQMITMTARHGHKDRLADLLERMKDAKQRFARHRKYGEIKKSIIGTVTATEVTGGGKHGWHPHFHMIVVSQPNTDLSDLEDVWMASLHGAGLSGTGDGWDIRNADAIGSYIAKWGAAEEITLQGQKEGRSGGGRTPMQLLADATLGDERAERLWREFAMAFSIDKRRRQLVWSRGLKALAGVVDVADDEAAEAGRLELDRQNIRHKDWTASVASKDYDRRGRLLEAAQDQTAADALKQVLEIVPSHEEEQDALIERERQFDYEAEHRLEQAEKPRPVRSAIQQAKERQADVKFLLDAVNKRRRDAERYGRRQDSAPRAEGVRQTGRARVGSLTA